MPYQTVPFGFHGTKKYWGFRAELIAIWPNRTCPSYSAPRTNASMPRMRVGWMHSWRTAQTWFQTFGLMGSDGQKKLPNCLTNIQGCRAPGLWRTYAESGCVVDAGALGEWYSLVKPPTGLPLVTKFEDLRILTRPFASMRDFLQCCWIALRGKVYHLLNRAPVSMGRSLVAQLSKILPEA